MKKTALDYALIVIGGVILLATGVYLLATWSTIPNLVPIHFNFSGAVDQMGGKSTLWVIYAIEACLYVFCTVMTQFPKTWNNQPKSKDPVMQLKYIQTYQRMMEVLDLLLVILFAGIILFVIHGMTGLNTFFVITFVLIIFTSIFFGVKASKYNK